MIERDKQTEEAFERLKSVLGETPKGTLVPWDTIESTMGRNRNDRGGWHIVGKFRRWVLRHRRIVTYPQTMDGLRFLTDKEAAMEVPALRQTRARRQLHRGVREVDVVDRSKLSDWERRVLVTQERNIRDERRNIGRSTRTLSSLLKAREVSPRTLPAVPPPVATQTKSRSDTNPPRWTKPT